MTSSPDRALPVPHSRNNENVLSPIATPEHTMSRTRPTPRKPMTLEAAVYALWDVYEAGTPMTPGVISCYLPPFILSTAKTSLTGTNCRVDWGRSPDQNGRTVGKLVLTLSSPDAADLFERVSIAVQNPHHPDFNPNPFNNQDEEAN